MEISFAASLWRWNSHAAPWYFLSLPEDLSDEIEAGTQPATSGFGAVRVSVRIGTSEWMTSLFPSREHKTYLLPVRKSVRVAQNIEEGDVVEVHLSVVG